jgi:hypothetical protein
MDRKINVNFIENKPGKKNLATASCLASELLLPLLNSQIYLDIDRNKTFIVEDISFFYSRSTSGVHSELELNTINIFVS